MTQYPILAIDYGTKHIGLAISDFKGIIATPLEVLHITQKNGYEKIVEKISDICENNKVQTILLGKPQIFHISHQKTIKKINQFEQILKDGIKLPILFHDESYSTITAQDMLLCTSQSTKKSRKKIDSVAAAVFLQEFLNSKSQDNV
ncbi:Holliday junction resolvase RuvX [bacterium]|nr:Holliday junction resolvase RuvX [bacterium]